MIDKKLIKKIKKINWYRQGGAVLPYYSSQGYRWAFIYFDGFNYFKGRNNYGYFDKDKQRIICDKIIRKQLNNKDYIITEFITPWNKFKNKHNLFNKKITAKYLSNLSEKKFLKVHKKFIDLRSKVWEMCVLIEAFDPWGDSIINEHLSKYKLNINPDDLVVLLAPEKLTFIQKEFLDRLKIVKKLKNKENIKKDLLEHTNKYYWIHNTWAEIKYLNKKYFMNLIKKESKKNINLINTKIEELQNYESNINIKKKNIIKKYKIPKKIKNLFFFFAAMTDWRDARKKQILKVNYISDLFLRELSRRTGIKHEYLLYLYDYEAKSIKYIQSIRKEIEKRPKGSIYYIFGKGIKWFIGKQAEKLHNLLEASLTKSKEIKGIIANKGVAKGHVKIITTPADFKKMKQGDVIVTQMTRPEYMPILHKAAAIITEEGGLTCHAAIVSRELNIPCIIATQIARSVLKDNDLVKVDANKGVVKKVK